MALIVDRERNFLFTIKRRDRNIIWYKIIEEVKWKVSIKVLKLWKNIILNIIKR